jgi:hypothetical protein
MLRFILSLLSGLGCFLGGGIAAVAGMCVELHCPLSPENFEYALQGG